MYMLEEKVRRPTTASTCLGYVTILACRRFAPRQESRHYASQVKQMLDGRASRARNNSY